MKKTLLIGLLVIIGAIFLITRISNYNSDIVEDDLKEKYGYLVEKDFEELSIKEKEQYLKLFIDAAFQPFKSNNAEVSMKLSEAFNKMVKFPNTLEFENALGGWSGFEAFVTNSRIVDAEKGILEVSGKYRSENNLGQKVQNNYYIKYKYNGKGFEVLDASFQ